MTAGRTAFWWALRAHWALGPVMLLSSADVPRAASAATLAAFAAGTRLDRAGAPRAGWGRAAPFAGAALLAACAADVAFGSRDLLVAASMLVLGIQALLLLLPKTPRDGWQLCAISFLEFLAAAASTTGLRFALFALAFLWLSIAAMWELHAEQWRAEGGGTPSVPPRTAAWILLPAAAGGFAMTAVLFAVTPRVGFARIARRLARPEAVSGFSDEISLAGAASVRPDRTVVARVEFPDAAPGFDPSALLLRGGAYSRFDGARWTRSVVTVSSVPRAGFVYLLGPPPRGTRLSTAEITLEPMEHPALFVYGAPVTVEGNLGTITADPQGGFAFARPGHAAVRYRLRFAPGTPPPERTRNRPTRDDLALPPGSEEIRALAGRLAAGARTGGERAARVVRHFRAGFRYTLTDPAADVRDFLFGKRAGYCEHFATALCLLLRASGIPARVAAGYLGGEWSDLGNYLIVRRSNAHAWTEAWVGGRWLALDATPPAARSAQAAPTGPVGILLDWVRQRWTKYVIDYSSRTQAEAASAGWSALRAAGARIAAAGRDVTPPPAGAAAVAAAALAGAAAVARALRHRAAPNSRGAAGRGRDAAPVPRAYRLLARALERRGHRKGPGCTMAEMIGRASARTPGLPAEASRFLSLYHRDRFGPAPLDPAEAAEAASLAARLRAAVRRGRAS